MKKTKRYFAGSTSRPQASPMQDGEHFSIAIQKLPLDLPNIKGGQPETVVISDLDKNQIVQLMTALTKALLKQGDVA